MAAVWAALAALSVAASSPDLVQHARSVSGTASRFDFGTGSLLPVVARPWGMNNWAAQTNNYQGARLGPLSHWWFHPEDREFYGFRCTHQASPWIYDYGEFLITPSVGKLEQRWPDKASAWNRSSAQFGPDLTNLTLQSYCTGPEADGGCLTAALTATERAAMLSLRFPPEDRASGWEQTRHLRVLVGRSGAWLFDKIAVGDDRMSFSGYTRANSGGVPSVLTPVPAEILEQMGSYQASCNSAASGFNMSHTVQLQGHDLNSVNVTRGQDPIAACVSSCAEQPGCAAFVVQMRRPTDPLDTLDVCMLKSAAEMASDPEALDGTTVSAWNASSPMLAQRPKFAHYFYAEVDAPIAGHQVKQVSDSMYVLGLEGVFSFNASVTNLNLKIGTSFISIEQAKQNLHREVPPGCTFEQLRSENRESWNSLFRKSQLVDSGNRTTEGGLRDLGTWYTNLYRSSIFPRMLYELDSQQQPIHYSPYTGEIHPGRLSSDSGFWDAYRTVYPLNSVIRADQMAIQMEGWMNAYKESGNIPGWASPGSRGAMTGQMQDASVADAIVKGLPGFEPPELAYQAILQDAQDTARTGRKGLSDYLRLGYLPTGKGYQDEVSATLNYALADYSMSLAASHLGDTANASVLAARAATAWSLLWDGSVRGGFFRSKSESGQFDEPFDEFAWAGPYTEAAAWQYRFYVPFDPIGLSKAYQSAGGSMCEYLHQTMTGKRSNGTGGPGSTFHNGAWGLHHEQTEMVESCFGQYEHNNQPVWHIPWMFAPAGCSSAGQYWLRQITSRLYSPVFFSGDEDNGSMSSWFLLSAMGIYQLVPGNTSYSIGSPLYRHLKLQLDNGKLLEIRAVNNSESTPYVESVHFNGVKLGALAIEYEQLRAGGILDFQMSSVPHGP